MRKTKVIVTLGPATSNVKCIEEMISLGVDGFRLNFSHKDHITHLKNIKMIRILSKKLQKEVAIVQDIGGHKIRIKGVEGVLGLKIGDILKVSKEKSDDRYTINFSHDEVIDKVGVAQTIYFNDGTISAIITQKYENYILLKILNNGKIYADQGVNFPYCDLELSGFSQKDLVDLNFGANYEIDIVALSYIKNRNDVVEVKDFLHGLGSKAKVFAKIENSLAVKNIDEILSVSDGVMIARGDLGIEMGLNRIPHIQKDIIKKANALGLPSVTSNQILFSMLNSKIPTRAEISDIANALYDGVDAIMLSDETAIGKYPIESVIALNEAILEGEIYYYFNREITPSKSDIFASSAVKIASLLDVKGIISFSENTKSARSIAKYRPNKTIYTISYCEQTQRQLSLIWGVNPIFTIKKAESSKELIEAFVKKAKEINLIDDESKFILTMGCNDKEEDSIECIKLIDSTIADRISA